MDLGTEAQKLVWSGAIPLQIHLHDSEITALSPPPPLLVLGPRLGYLPLLAPLLKSHFSNSLPPVVDNIWFDYKGLPLKWYIPTGVLFDLLCAEPERPWSLTVHFRGYPSELLSPCDGEESVKWSFINSLKEAAYIINGNCKNVMNMSQSDQKELWQSVEKGNLERYLRVASKLKLGALSEESKIEASCQLSTSETDHKGHGRTGRVPVRLYLRNVNEYLDEFEDATPVNNWDDISYINQPVDTRKKKGTTNMKCLFWYKEEEEEKELVYEPADIAFMIAAGAYTLHDALRTLLPEFFTDEPSIDDEITKIVLVEVPQSAEVDSETVDLGSFRGREDDGEEVSSDKHFYLNQTWKSRIKRICIQGIEPQLDLPFCWIISNLMNPEFYLHICLYVAVPTGKNIAR